MTPEEALERIEFLEKANEQDLQLWDADVKDKEKTIKRYKEALEFYADTETYFATNLFCDPPCGDFRNDFSELTDSEKEIWDDYRGKGGEYYGKTAREALK